MAPGAKMTAMGAAGRAGTGGRAELLDIAGRLQALAADGSAAHLVRLKALNALGGLGTKGVTPGVARILLEDADPAIRQEAAGCLGLCGGRSALRPLVKAMTSDEDRRVRNAATWAIGFLGDERAVPRLLGVLGNSNESGSVRASAAEAIGHMEKRPPFAETTAGLLAGLRDRDIEVRFWCAFALGCVGDADVIPELERLARGDRCKLDGWWSVRREARDAIRSIRDREKPG
jgi:HEAT repeat protein